MKKYFILAAAALSFAACSSDDEVITKQEAGTEQGQVPVLFDSYVERGTTRAGLTGVLDKGNYDTGTSKYSGMSLSGFGVFAYYTNADNYDQNFTPNFMYNQRVYNNSDAADTYTWTYAPIKYWPNEYGFNATNGASSDDVDKVSFFAYAPFVTVNTATGKVNGNGSTYTTDDGDATYGIVGMKRNNAAGDPMIKYIATFYTDKQVDLVWGTQTGTWTLKNTALGQSFTAGKPWLDVQHPSVTSTPLKFDFKHGLARLNVTVDTKTSGTSAADPASGTKVFIRSVTFEGFDVKGALNLNNTTANTALWYNFDCQDELNNGAEITIKDGRKDGKEGLSEAAKEYAAINPTFVQTESWSSTAGVTATAGNLFCTSLKEGPATSADPIFVIPNNDPLKVTIEYDVLTTDGNLAGYLNDGVTKGSVVKNVITRYITRGASAAGSVGKPANFGETDGDGIKMANGKQYTIALHLGLNDVEFDAEVTPWPATVNGGADLPHNN